MRDEPEFGSRGGRNVALIAVALVFVTAAVLSCSAQINGPAPTVMSLPLSHFLPNPRPSVTSLGPFGYAPYARGAEGAPNIYQFPYGSYPYNRPRPGHGRDGRGNGYGGGYAYSYAIPYYVPYDPSGNGYDYVPGPDINSAPPEPMAHMIVEQPPPAPPAGYPDERRRPEHYATQAAPAAEPVSEPVRNVEPTVLVFRDGRQQEVSNYAIMGDVVYVFGDRAKKIALSDLDMPATVKANDDRGLEFTVPVSKAQKKQDPVSQPKAPATTSKPDSVAAVLP